MHTFFMRHFGPIGWMNHILLCLLAFFFITFHTFIFLTSSPQSFAHVAYQFHFSAPVALIGIIVVYFAPETLKEYLLAFFALILLGYHLFYTYVFAVFFFVNAGIIAWIH